METLNNKRDSWLSWTLFAGLLFVFAVVATGCGGDKKSGGGGPVSGRTPTDGQYQGCPSCPQVSDYLGSAVGYTQGGAANMDIGLEMFGGFDAAGGATAGNYQGPMVANGFLEVRSYNGYSGGCQIPAGYYELHTVAEGQWTGNNGTWDFTGLRMEAVGPRRVLLTVDYGVRKTPNQTVVGPDGREYEFGFMGQVTLEKSDNVACGSYWGPESFTFSYD